MPDFFKLHQRQDIVLVERADRQYLAVVLGYNEDSYVLKPLAPAENENLATQAIEPAFDDDILQKVGSLDFDALHEATEGRFSFGDYVELEDF